MTTAKRDHAKLVSTAVALRVDDVIEWPNRGDRYRVLEAKQIEWEDGGVDLLVRVNDEAGIYVRRTFRFTNLVEPIRVHSFAPATDDDFKGL